jgi:type II secretory pathway component GspD/PulD (secretin)
MKHFFGVYTHQHIALFFFAFFLMLFSMLPIIPANSGETNINDKVVSLTVKDEPLGEVLKKISMANGCEFILDNEWQNHPVTADLEKVSLNQALTRILRDLNHVIIYDSDQKIRIVIYGKAVSGGASTIPLSGGVYSAPVKDESSVETSEPELPASQDVEKEETSGTEETPLDDTAVSDGKPKTHAPLRKQNKRHNVDDSDEK